MYYGQLIDALQPRLKDTDLSKDPNRSIGGRYINQAYVWIYSSHFWEWRRQVRDFTQIPNYTTGTCGVTQFTGANESTSRQVTLSNAPPFSVVGWYFQASTDSDWHRIIYVSGSTIYLESPINIASGSYSFKIWKRLYYLPSDVETITQIGKWSADGKLVPRDASELQNRVINISREGQPTDFAPYGDDTFFTSYNIGSIQIAKDTNIVIGTGTLWIGNVFPGDIFNVNSIDYRVKRVETDTRIILANYVSKDIAAGNAYTAKKEISVGLQLYPNENQYRTIPFVFFDKAFSMIHETLDRPNLPEKFDDVILTRAEYKYLKDKDNAKWLYVSQVLDNEMETLKSKFRVVQNPYQIFASKIHSSMPGRF